MTQRRVPQPLPLARGFSSRGEAVSHLPAPGHPTMSSRTGGCYTITGGLLVPSGWRPECLLTFLQRIDAQGNTSRPGEQGPEAAGVRQTRAKSWGSAEAPRVDGNTGRLLPPSRLSRRHSGRKPLWSSGSQGSHHDFSPRGRLNCT